MTNYPEITFSTVKFKSGPGDYLFAVVTDDLTDGYVIGEMHEVKRLHKALAALIEAGDAETVDHFDPRLGLVKWVSASEAADIARRAHAQRVTARAIRYACGRGEIKGAERDSSGWGIPLPSLRRWLSNRPKPGPNPKKKD